MTCFDICRTPVGWCGVVVSQRALQRVFLAEPQPESLVAAIGVHFPDARSDVRACRQAIVFLQWYFYPQSGARPSVMIDPGPATPFQRSVWNMAGSIPFGQVRTYGWLAGRIGCTGASRAVGTALARNPLPLIVPCHRIVRGNGYPGGFSATGGSILKRQLLEHEGVAFDSQGRVIV